MKSNKTHTEKDCSLLQFKVGSMLYHVNGFTLENKRNQLQQFLIYHLSCSLMFAKQLRYVFFFQNMFQGFLWLRTLFCCGGLRTKAYYCVVRVYNICVPNVSCSRKQFKYIPLMLSPMLQRCRYLNKGVLLCGLSP